MKRAPESRWDSFDLSGLPHRIFVGAGKIAFCRFAEGFRAFGGSHDVAVVVKGDEQSSTYGDVKSRPERIKDPHAEVWFIVFQLEN